ncbi:MAG TPA: DUF4350 domain-containing protein [Xanthobacteraceae bacterium]|nr:DUF4350 domain-containing protein [Xanthobacteraceae bacterium]
MSGEPIFSPRILTGWVAAAVAVFALTLYFMGGGQLADPAPVGPSTYSRSAIGYAGLADILQRLHIPVVKSRGNSAVQTGPEGVLVIAEPNATAQADAAVRALLKADTILFVLPKWTGARSDQKPTWLHQASELSAQSAQRALRFVAARGELVRESGPVIWTVNRFGPRAPNVVAPVQLIRGDRLNPLIAAEQGMLLAEIQGLNRRIWILADPDIIANHGLARPGNAELAVEIITRLRGPGGAVIFDETIHGFITGPVNPFLLLFRFPFVVATAQVLLAVALLLWASMARFGAPQPAPLSLSAGRQRLLQNIANLLELPAHQTVIFRRYVHETIRDVARQLHAPAGLSGESLITWLQGVGSARGVTVDCAAIARRTSELTEAGQRDLAPLVRLARDIYRWKREIIDGPTGNPRAH